MGQGCLLHFRCLGTFFFFWSGARWVSQGGHLGSKERVGLTSLYTVFHTRVLSRKLFSI